MDERLLYLNPHVGVDQGASLPQSEWKVTKGLLYLENLGRLRGFSIWILNCDDKGAFPPRSRWKVIKVLLYLGTWGDWEASLSQSWIVTTKGLLYLDMDGRQPKGFSTLEPGVIERLFYLNLKLWQLRGISTLIWMEGVEVQN